MGAVVRVWNRDNTPLSYNALQGLYRYLRENREYLIPIGKTVFDRRSLELPINLSICKKCLRYQEDMCDKSSILPLEAIKLSTGAIFVFCGCKLTESFSGYFYTYRQRICVNYENLNRAIARDVGENQYLRSLNIENILQDNIAGGYKPAYLERERVLRDFVGDKTYDRLVEQMEQV